MLRLGISSKIDCHVDNLCVFAGEFGLYWVVHIIRLHNKGIIVNAVEYEKNSVRIGHVLAETV